MKNLCENGSGPTHLTSYALGCSSWGTSSESDVQQSSMSKSLSLKMSVLPQQCHKTKPLSFQYQDRDSSSTQSTGQSYPEVGSAQSGICNKILSLSVYLTVLIASFFLFLYLYIFSIVKLLLEYSGMFMVKKKKMKYNKFVIIMTLLSDILH